MLLLYAASPLSSARQLNLFKWLLTVFELWESIYTVRLQLITDNTKLYTVFKICTYLNRREVVFVPTQVVEKSA